MTNGSFSVSSTLISKLNGSLYSNGTANASLPSNGESLPSNAIATGFINATQEPNQGQSKGVNGLQIALTLDTARRGLNVTIVANGTKTIIQNGSVVTSVAPSFDAGAGVPGKPGFSGRPSPTTSATAMLHLSTPKMSKTKERSSSQGPLSPATVSFATVSLVSP